MPEERARTKPTFLPPIDLSGDQPDERALMVDRRLHDDERALKEQTPDIAA